MDLLKCSCYSPTFALKIFFQKSNWNLIITSIIRNSIHLLPDHKALRVGKTQVKGEQLQPQTTRTEGEFSSLLFHPLPHRDRDNHSTQKWPSGLIGWPTDFDTNWFSLIGKCLHNYLKKKTYFSLSAFYNVTHTLHHWHYPSLQEKHKPPIFL